MEDGKSEIILASQIKDSLKTKKARCIKSQIPFQNSVVNIEEMLQDGELTNFNEEHLSKKSIVNAEVAYVGGLTDNQNPKNLNHLVVHTIKKENEFEDCETTSSDITEVMPQLISSHVCKYCDKSFSLRSSLNTHFRLHTNNICEICGVELRNKSYMKIHLRVHSNEKPYVCDICGNAFVSGSALNNHLSYHKRRNSYICHLCSKTLSSLGSLKRHLITHTKETPYACDFCGRAISRLDELKRHLRIHTKEKPYVCEVCGKAFNTHSDLKRHSLIHTKE